MVKPCDLSMLPDSQVEIFPPAAIKGLVGGIMIMMEGLGDREVVYRWRVLLHMIETNNT
jgi:hypothetical protein